MKVLVVNTMAPFVHGGAEALADSLRENLIIAGHEAEVLRIPFKWEPATRVVPQMLMVRALELRNVDRVIALKFPAYLIRHPVKTVWLLHQYRQAYDLYDAGRSNLPVGETGQEIRGVIRTGDDESFRESLPLMFDFLGVPDPELPVPRMDPEARQRQIFAVPRRDPGARPA